MVHMHRVENKHTNVHTSIFNLPHNATFLQLIPLINASYKIDVRCVDAETTSVSVVSKWMMLGVSTLQGISKFVLWTTSSKIVQYYIDHGSIGIHQCSMQNILQFLSHTTYTRSLNRVGLTVNGKLNTQLTYGHLEMCCPKKCFNTHWLFPGDKKMRSSMVHTESKRRRVTGFRCSFTLMQ